MRIKPLHTHKKLKVQKWSTVVKSQNSLHCVRVDITLKIVPFCLHCLQKWYITSPAGTCVGKFGESKQVSTSGSNTCLLKLLELPQEWNWCLQMIRLPQIISSLFWALHLTSEFSQNTVLKPFHDTDNLSLSDNRQKYV